MRYFCSVNHEWRKRNYYSAPENCNRQKIIKWFYIKAVDVLPRLKMTGASNGMGFDENRTPLFKCFL